jgi:hypothetical protein
VLPLLPGWEEEGAPLVLLAVVLEMLLVLELFTMLALPAPPPVCCHSEST